MEVEKIREKQWKTANTSPKRARERKRILHTNIAYEYYSTRAIRRQTLSDINPRERDRERIVQYRRDNLSRSLRYNVLIVLDLKHTIPDRRHSL